LELLEESDYDFPQSTRDVRYFLCEVVKSLALVQIAQQIRCILLNPINGTP
jgi:hypothetical protein